MALPVLMLAACSGGDEGGSVSIAPLDENGAPATAAGRRGTPATPSPPQPPRIALQVFRPEHGYTSMAADRRGVYWLGGGIQLQAAVLTAGHGGENERVLARPGRPGEALGRPLPVGDWVVFPETQDTAASGGPWRVRAVHLTEGRERLVDGDRDGWEGLSLAVAGTRLVYTVAVGSGVEVASEVRLWESTAEAPRTILRTSPGVTLQRIAFDGESAAAVRTSRGADGAVSTDVVELDLVAAQLIPLPAQGGTLPAIAPRWIAWVTIPASGQPNQLLLYDRRTHTSRVIAESGPGRSLFNPSITGNIVTWNSSDTSEVAVYDAAQRATFTVDRGVVGKVWAYDGVLVWTALNTTSRQYEMKVGVLGGPP